MPMGSSLRGLRMLDPLLSPPSTWAEVFCLRCLQSHLQTSPPTPQKSYQKFLNPRTTFQNTPFSAQKMHSACEGGSLKCWCLIVVYAINNQGVICSILDICSMVFCTQHNTGNKGRYQAQNFENFEREKSCVGRIFSWHFGRNKPLNLWLYNIYYKK